MTGKGVSADVMAEIDRAAREDYGIPQTVLMENAGRAAVDVILNRFPLIEDERIAIFCGKGNNGGDGFVMARLLSEKNPAELSVYVPDRDTIKPGAPLENFRRIQEKAITILPLNDFMWKDELTKDITLVVDAVFGTGFRGDLPDGFASLGGVLNASGAKIYSVDVPSGLNSTTGKA